MKENTIINTTKEKEVVSFFIKKYIKTIEEIERIGKIFYKKIDKKEIKKNNFLNFFFYNLYLKKYEKETKKTLTNIDYDFFDYCIGEYYICKKGSKKKIIKELNDVDFNIEINKDIFFIVRFYYNISIQDNIKEEYTTFESDTGIFKNSLFTFEIEIISSKKTKENKKIKITNYIDLLNFNKKNIFKDINKKIELITNKISNQEILDNIIILENIGEKVKEINLEKDDISNSYSIKEIRKEILKKTKS